jgi:divalent metal cation (Fe/Co/Zn/Cd) transporter
MATTALLLASETKSPLIGETANKEVVQGIREIACSYKEIKQVNEVLTMHMGPDFILVNISVDFVDRILATGVEVTVRDWTGPSNKPTRMINAYLSK